MLIIGELVSEFWKLHSAQIQENVQILLWFTYQGEGMGTLLLLNTTVHSCHVVPWRVHLNIICITIIRALICYLSG